MLPYVLKKIQGGREKDVAREIEDREGDVNSRGAFSSAMTPEFFPKGRTLKLETMF